MREIFAALHVAFRSWSRGSVPPTHGGSRDRTETELDVELVGQVEQKQSPVERDQAAHARQGDETAIARELRQDLKRSCNCRSSTLAFGRIAGPCSGYQRPQAILDDDVAIWGSLFGWCFVHSLAKSLKRL
jgi:hypothetical protein